MSAWLWHETQIGNYLYPLRAIAVASGVGLKIAVTATLILLHFS